MEDDVREGNWVVNWREKIRNTEEWRETAAITARKSEEEEEKEEECLLNYFV